MYCMDPYDAALKLILEKGVTRTNRRTGIKTLSIFGVQSRYQIDQCFPILTRRKVWPKAIFAELLWFLSGSTNNKDLQALGSNIWTPWVNKEFEGKHHFEDGSFGPVYGFQLRHFGGNYPTREDQTIAANMGIQDYYGMEGFDQLDYMLKRIKEDPSCRRILFSLWNPKQMHQMRLPPCHILFQIWISDEGQMSGMLTQRSCDFPIGVPANIQFYSTLTYMIAQQTGFRPYEFIWNGGDCHIYEDQIPSVEEYLSRPVADSPKLVLHPAPDIFSYKLDHFEVADYNPLPAISIPVAV